jgi:hypothetical protein
MAARIIRQKLFDNAELKAIQEKLSRIEAAAAVLIAKHPEKRDLILQRMDELARNYVRGEKRKKKKEAIWLGIFILGAGILVACVCAWLETKSGIWFALSASLMISGIGTAGINGVAFLFDSFADE